MSVGEDKEEDGHLEAKEKPKPQTEWTLRFPWS